MGNCSNEDQGSKRPAYENLQILFPKGNQKSPIMFSIKEWPNCHSIDLRNPKSAVSRFIDLSLFPGEHIEITLKNHQSQLKERSSGLEKGQVLLSRRGLHCQITRDNQFYQLRFPVDEERRHLWIFLRGWTAFNVEDVMRMGVTSYRLAKFVIEDSCELQQLKQTLHREASAVSESATRCRICLSSVDSHENPFISPCKCQGSIRMTHLRCLASWLFSSTLTQGHFLSVRTNKTMCELCKTDLTSNSINKSDTAEYDRMENLLLTHLHQIPPPYAIIDYRQGEQNNGKSYLVLSFKNKQQYTFGRTLFGKGSPADITQNDIHISRINTQLKFTTGGLFVRDCQSLHGTFMQVREPLRLCKANSSEQLAFHNMLFQVSFDSCGEQEKFEVLPGIPSAKIL